MRTYSFRDEWEVDAPPARVWGLIEQPETYPLWWPIYLDARVVEDKGPVGSVAALKFRVLLPYTLTVTTRSTRSEAPRLLEGTVSGELEGTWRWTLEPAGGGTKVTFEETVRTNRWILDLLGPVANRLFALNHRIAARKGAEGMRAYLARPGAGAEGAANLRQSAHSTLHGAPGNLPPPPRG
jgi:uncharacterized protein YndB with AHSA1/START domain